MQFNDYYKTLEVELTASAKEIRESYRKLAHKYHPDISEQSNCEPLFKEITEAYAALKSSGRQSGHGSLYTQANCIEL
ncbi:DnaJ domain-containing protein [Marinomonas polaris DSM 16579]|uniref:DnaJ domain-containing protein n=1 Tax=Marinomonas polaris DSM 16579 TaxID=1122206 RepID=A0A1M5MKN4_9GAMM|nr:DnaJ domain-containing protein [Marinomonas polaris]SHG77821.1 DnaJ domain-containing protein [Marinomonas polaris DSM 16579]